MFKRRLKRTQSGYVIRPLKGKCPRCKVPENQYCRDSCDAVDPASAARE